MSETAPAAAAAEVKPTTPAMKKAIITGITGQDGSYLAEFLLEKVGFQGSLHYCCVRRTIYYTPLTDRFNTKLDCSWKRVPACQH